MAKNRLLHLGLAAIFVVGLAALAALAHAQDPGPLAALGTAFTYQGHLKRDGTAYSGSCAMTFRLYDAASDGNLIGTVPKPSVPISNSLFTVPIDFGAGAFPGDRRWLGIDVQCTGDSGVTPLPRHELTAVPYALSAASTGPHSHWGQNWTGSSGTGLTLSGGNTGLSGSGSVNGLYGTSPYTLTSGNGVYGLSSGHGGAGVFGYGYDGDDGNLAYGVYGKGGPYGVVGVGDSWSGYFFARTNGVYGGGTSTGVEGVGGTTGVYGSGTTYGIYGTTTGSATPRYAGYFAGNVQITGTLVTQNLQTLGSKSAVVNTHQGMRALYAIESPESWFEDFGTATLAGGRVVITIDALYAETVNLQQNYHVFLTPRGDCRGLYVTALTPTTFEVRELGGGRAAVDFDYRIVAKRRGQEALRLEAVHGGAR